MFRCLPDLFRQAADFEIKKGVFAIQEGLGILLDDGRILLQPVAEEVCLFTDCLACHRICPAVLLIFRVFCVAGQAPVGHRLLLFQVVQNGVDLAETVIHIISVRFDQFIQPVQKHLGVPGFVRLHSLVIAALFCFDAHRVVGRRAQDIVAGEESLSGLQFCRSHPQARNLQGLFQFGLRNRTSHVCQGIQGENLDEQRHHQQGSSQTSHDSHKAFTSPSSVALA